MTTNKEGGSEPVIVTTGLELIVVHLMELTAAQKQLEVTMLVHLIGTDSSDVVWVWLWVSEIECGCVLWCAWLQVVRANCLHRG